MNFKDKNISIIGLGLTLVIASNIIGHFAAPFSIFVTPLLLTIIIAGINSQLYKSNFLLTIIYNIGLLLFNDLFIRYYAGGTHDQVGKAWISLFFTISFILAFITMLIFSFMSKDNKNKTLKSNNILKNIFALLILTTFTSLIYYYVIADI